MSYNTILATAPLTTSGFHLKATGTTIGNSLIWDNGTNVGIGNTNTSYTLDVSGTGRFTGALNGTSAVFSSSVTALDKININQDQAAFRLYNAAATFVGGIGNGSWVEGSIITNVALYSVGDLKFYTGGSSTNKLGITSGGSVLLGTTTNSNDVRLQVAASGGISSWISGTFSGYGNTDKVVIGNLNTYGAMIGAHNSALSAWADFYISGTNLIFGSSGTTERMRITSGGVVQITGLTSNGTVSTQSSNGSLYVSSDANLKIEDGFVENGLGKVLALKPRYFYWKDKEAFSADRQLGFYAQEVNAVSEETANTPPEGCGWGIYDRGLVALLTSAIQEMNTKLDEQNQTIQNLQEQINILAK